MKWFKFPAAYLPICLSSNYASVYRALGMAYFVCGAKFELTFPLVLMRIWIRILNGLYPYWIGMALTWKDMKWQTIH